MLYLNKFILVFAVDALGMWMTDLDDILMEDDDRRQELVFIGMKLDHEHIQTVLDQCLLNEKEIYMEPGKWRNIMDFKEKTQCPISVQLLFEREEIAKILPVISVSEN